jgi:opacity protein-like surface antigen
MRKLLSIFVLAILFSSSAHALYTELGISYGKKQTTYDQYNYFDSESLTGSISFYFLERLALELSYTDATGTHGEKAIATDPRRITTQKSQIIGADLIYVLTDKTSTFQPYIKGGVAQINRRQDINIEGEGDFPLDPDNAIVPSYGVGIKIMITDSLSLKFSYDVWRTPIGGGQQTDDDAIRAGISWVL